MRTAFIISVLAFLVVWKPETDISHLKELIAGIIIFCACCDLAEIFRRR